MSVELRRRSSSKDYARHHVPSTSLSSSSAVYQNIDSSRSASRFGAYASNLASNGASSSYGYGKARPTAENTESDSFEGGSFDDLDALNGFEMGNRRRSTSAYSQLPNGHSASTSAAERLTSLFLARWQRNSLIAAAVILSGLLIIYQSGDASSSWRTHKHAAGSSPELVQEVANWRENTDFIAENNKADVGTKTLDIQTPETGIAKVDGSSSATCRLAPGKQETQYALMIDAGSTGSRMHVYTFSNCLSSGIAIDSQAAKDALPTLRDELFYPVTPGLSSYKGNPKAAAESLTKLMEEAVRAVPKSEHACTPVAVKATAGLRLLGAKESQAILDEVESWLHSRWPFHVVDNGVVIMDGSDEGVYAWITINYLLGLVGPGAKGAATAAVMDLGGASTQIVFEPSFPSTSKLSPGDHVYDLNFAATKHTLYQHSHLGYGLMQARRSVNNLVAFTYVWQSVPKGKPLEWDDLSEQTLIHNPCLVKDGRKVVLLDPPGRKAVNVTFIGTGAGFDACRRIVDVVMAKDALCDVEPCAFGGVYQPKLMDTFGSGPIYALSYFYDRIVPLGLGKKDAPFTISDLRQLSEDVCAGPHPSGTSTSSSTRGWTRFKDSLEAMAELEDRPEYCLDLSFMYSLLSLGYELSPERELVTGKKINDIELGWALGAGIALLEHASLKCRVP